MLLELYLTFVRLALEYGDYQAMLIIAFLSSLVAFAAAAATMLALKNTKPWWFAAFLATEAWFLAAQTFTAFWYHTAVPLFLFFQPATYVYLLFVVPLAMVYRRVMERWPVLPWHLILYVLTLLGCAVLWYFLVFVFGVLAVV
jgi:hypothetical protein